MSLLAEIASQAVPRMGLVLSWVMALKNIRNPKATIILILTPGRAFAVRDTSLTLKKTTLALKL